MTHQELEQYKPKIAENILFRIENDRAVLFDVIEGEPYILNESATDVWRCFDGGTTLAQIVSKIYKLYQGEPADIKKDVLNFVAALVEKEFLELT